MLLQEDIAAYALFIVLVAGILLLLYFYLRKEFKKIDVGTNRNERRKKRRGVNDNDIEDGSGIEDFDGGGGGGGWGFGGEAGACGGCGG